MSHLKVCYHSYLVAAGFGFLKEFAAPLQIIDAIDRLIISRTHKRTQRENTKVQSRETWNMRAIGFASRPQRLATLQKGMLVENGVNIVDSGEEGL